MHQDGHGVTRTITHLMKPLGLREHQLVTLNQHLLKLGNKTINQMLQDGLGVIRITTPQMKQPGLKEHQ